MILSTHGVLASQIASFDADAVAFFNRVTTAGGSLSNTEKVAVNQLVLDMKSAGIWSAMKAVYPMVGASADACKQNLVSSSFTGTFSTGWTFASTGVTPNGTSAYMDTGLNANTVLTNNNVHLSFYSRTQDSSKSAHDMGVETVGSNFFDLFLYYNGVTSKGFIDGNYPTNATQINNTNTLGYQIGARTSSTSQKLYWNNSLLVTNTTTKTLGLPSNNIYLGATNNGGTAGAFTNKQCAFSSIGDGLTDTQASNFYTAVQAFQTTLSRQV